MNRRILASALASATIAGVVALVVPQHGASAVRVAAVTVAVVTAALVLAAVGPVVARDPEASALDRARPPAVTPLDPHGLRDARRDLDRRTAGAVVPPAVRDRLRSAAVTRQLDPDRVDVLLHESPVPRTDRDPDAVSVTVHRVLDRLDPGAPDDDH